MPIEELPPVLLLDLDDTILTFSAGPRDFWAEAFAVHADELPGITSEAFRAAIRDAADQYWGDPQRAAEGRQDLFEARRRVVDGALGRLDRDPAPAAHRLADHYTRTKEDAGELFPRALEGLRCFRERGMRLGLITNGSSSFQRAKLARYDLEPYFEAIFVEGEFGIGKPHASVFQAALDALDARPDDAWMVGDNLYADIAGAQAVGIAGVWHDYSRSGLPAEPPALPKHVIHGWGELLEACR